MELLLKHGASIQAVTEVRCIDYTAWGVVGKQAIFRALNSKRENTRLHPKMKPGDHFCGFFERLHLAVVFNFLLAENPFPHLLAFWALLAHFGGFWGAFRAT